MSMTLAELADIVLDVIGDLRHEDRTEPADRILEMIVDAYPISRASRPVVAAMIVYELQRPWGKPAPSQWTLSRDSRRRDAEIAYHALEARRPGPRYVDGPEDMSGTRECVRVTVELDGTITTDPTHTDPRCTDAILEASGLLPYATELRAAVLEFEALKAAE